MDINAAKMPSSTTGSTKQLKEIWAVHAFKFYFEKVYNNFHSVKNTHIWAYAMNLKYPVELLFRYCLRVLGVCNAEL